MQETWILLKERELVRLRVIKRALLGLPAHAAADMLKLSILEVFRLKARVRARRECGIVHDNRGRQPANALPVSLRQRVLQLHRAKFSRCNDCHLVEILAEEYQIKLNPETARRWLRAAGVPPKRRHRSRSNRRRQRERRPRFGELVFIDGSPQDRGPGRNARRVLL
ncbi:MAG: integrase, partial [bacterium]